MKAVSASMWLLTVSAGNLIILVVAETQFFDRAWEVSACLLNVRSDERYRCA
jgi:dipeptide/tripeptide permease